MVKVRLRWFGADLQYSCKHGVFLSSFYYFNRNYISLDSQRRMLCDDINYVNVEYKIDVNIKKKLKNEIFNNFI